LWRFFSFGSRRRVDIDVGSKGFTGPGMPWLALKRISEVKIANRQPSHLVPPSADSAEAVKGSRRGRLRQFRRQLLSWMLGDSAPSPRRGRLLLERLEGRQMMAGDVEMLYTTGADDFGLASDEPAILAMTSSSLPEGEMAPDLVAFAKALDAADVTFFRGGMVSRMHGAEEVVRGRGSVPAVHRRHQC